MKQIIVGLFIMLLVACSEPPVYRVFTMTAGGDYLETITVTNSIEEAEAVYTLKYREREDCSENCENTFQQLYIATEPCRQEYTLTVCKEINQIKKW